MDSSTVRIKGLEIGKGHPVRIMGIVNLSPESFYKGSVANDPSRLTCLVRKMGQAGADLIDIGGASTAPKTTYNTTDVSLREELERVVAAIEMIHDITDMPLSVDTSSSRVAEAAINLGVSIVNDVSGLHRDEKMARLIADSGVAVILMADYTKSAPDIQSILNSLKSSLNLATKAGIPNGHIILDPGIGFGKPVEVDFSIIRRLDVFSALGFPILVGVSRKAFIGSCLNQSDPEDRLTGTIAATSVAVVNGADIIRAHDVEEARLASKIGETLRNPLSE
ncbi:MAG: dihydropteroate synthase [Candidatus Thorarchaeota archaeon]